MARPAPAGQCCTTQLYLPLLKPSLFSVFPPFTLCLLVSECELILGVVLTHSLNYHLVFNPHISSLCPITVEISISEITHGLE